MATLKTNMEVVSPAKINKRLPKLRQPIVIEAAQLADPKTKIFGRGKELIPVKLEKPKDSNDLRESLRLEPPSLSGDHQQRTLWQSLTQGLLTNSDHLNKPLKEFASKVDLIVKQKELKLGYKLRDRMPKGEFRP